MKQELTLSGMSCGHCVMAVKETLKSHDGVHVESVEIGKAVISTADYASIEAQLKLELAEEGYPVESSRTI